MKLKVYFLLLLILICSTSAVCAAEVPIYRLYNNHTGEHLYTSDKSEADILARSGWRGEGIGWYAPSSGEPVYRVFHPIIGEHLYVTTSSYLNHLVSNAGWIKDNNGKPVFYSGGSLRIWRLYHEKANRHHYTADFEEFAALPSFGWHQEGIYLYGLH